MPITNLSQRTVALLIREGEVLLGYKKTGFGKGNYLGIGGKVEKGESVQQAAERELNEETEISRPAFTKVADLTFLFPEKPSWSQQVHVFSCKDWVGNPKETEEIKPKWFHFDDLPLTHMWDDAKFWLPAILSGHQMDGEFIFNNDLKVIEVKLEEWK